MKASKAFFDTVSRLGITRIFGNPGTTELPLLNELGSRGDIQYILTLTDGLAVGLAEGETLLTSKPSLVNLHTVPGLGNSIAFLHSALRNRSPILVTAGNQDTRHFFHEPVLYGDLTSIASPVVKASFEARTALDVQRLLIRAWKTALTPPFGPVFVSLPMNLVEEEDSNFATNVIKFEYSLGVPKVKVEEISRELNSSSNSAIVVGYEVAQMRVHGEVDLLARKTGLPVFSEPRPVRASFDTSNPKFRGILSSKASEINKALDSFDFLLFIGTNISPLLYSGQELLPGKKIVEITSDPEEASRRLWDTCICDLRETLIAIRERSSKKPSRVTDGTKSVRGNDKIVIQNKEECISPTFVFRTLAKLEGSRVVFDELSSTMSPVLLRNLGFKPGNYFHLREQLGWALAAGIGYGVSGGSPLVITGDGAFNYSVQALWTASHYPSNVKILVLDNSGYGVLKKSSIEKYPKIMNSMWLNPSTEAEKLGDAYGILSQVTDKPENLKKELAWLIAGKEPKLLRVCVTDE